MSFATCDSVGKRKRVEYGLDGRKNQKILSRIKKFFVLHMDDFGRPHINGYYLSIGSSLGSKLEANQEKK